MRLIDLSSYSPSAQRALAMAGVMARGRLKSRTLQPEHLAFALSEQDGTTARAALNALGVDLFRLRSLLTLAVETGTDPAPGNAETTPHLPTEGGPLPLADLTAAVLAAAGRATGSAAIGTGQVLQALLTTPTLAGGILGKLGLTADKLRDTLETLPPQPGDGDGAERGVVDLLALARAGRLPPLLARPRYGDALARAAMQQVARGAVLAGEPGSGRWSVVLALAVELAASQTPAIPGLIAITRDALPADPRPAVQRAADQAQAAGAALAVPDSERFFGTNAAPLMREAQAILRRAAAAGVRLILTASPATAAAFESDDALRALVRINVEPASEAETAAVLALHRPELERRHKVTIAPEVLPRVVEMAGRYLPGVLPEKAVHLLDAACAQFLLTRARGGTATDDLVDEAEVAEVVQSRTGIPLGQIVGPEQERLARMEAVLQERIAGQDVAVQLVSRAIRRARAGMKDPKRPIASFLFLGPTGVGKTELANALAEFLFNDEAAQIRLDMSEYQERNSVARMVGAPPGYVGYEEGGQLTEAVRRRPYAIVLFDEIEKAHPEVFNALLQVLENGRLTDGRGRTADFRNTVIILTSNAGSEFLTGQGDPAQEETAARDALRASFRPEFLNRLDSIVVFHHLDETSLRRILNLMLNKTVKLLRANRRIDLTITDAARDLLFRMAPPAELAEYGARPLRRLVADRVEAAVADAVFAGAFNDGDAVIAGARAGTLVFERAPQPQLGDTGPGAATDAAATRPRPEPAGASAEPAGAALTQETAAPAAALPGASVPVTASETGAAAAVPAAHDTHQPASAGGEIIQTPGNGTPPVTPP